MTRIENVLHQRYSYSQRHSNRSSIAIEEKLSKEEEDMILDSYPELIHENYRGWFVIRLREMGKAKFTNAAEHAIKYGRNKQKMFSYLIS